MIVITPYLIIYIFTKSFKKINEDSFDPYLLKLVHFTLSMII